VLSPEFIQTKQEQCPMAKKQAQDEPQTLTIDGTDYNLADLSDEAKSQVTNLRVTDQEIARLQQQLAIYQTARTAYAQALKAELPE